MSSRNYLTLINDNSTSGDDKYIDYNLRTHKIFEDNNNIYSQIEQINNSLGIEMNEDINFLDKMNFNVENLKDNNGYNVIIKNILNNKRKNRIKLNNSDDKLNNAKRIKEINNY